MGNITTFKCRTEGTWFRLLPTVSVRGAIPDIPGILQSGTDVVTVYSLC